MKLSAFILAVVTSWAGCATAQGSMGDHTDPTVAPWARESVQRLLQARIALGYPDGRFHGGQSASRFTASSMAGRLLTGMGTSKKLYSDRRADVLIVAFAPTAQQRPAKEIED